MYDFTAVYVAGAYPEVAADAAALLPIEVLLLRSPAAAGRVN